MRIKKNSKNYTIDVLLILRSHLLIRKDIKYPPKKVKENRNKNCEILIIPRNRAWITLRPAVMKTVNAPVELAWTGVELSWRYKGTRNIPPPKPSPLSIPAPRLFFTIKFLFLSINSSFFSRYILIWILKKYPAKMTIQTWIPQNKTEQFYIPTILGYFEEPFSRDRMIYPQIIKNKILNIFRFYSLAKGFTFVSLIMTLLFISSSIFVSVYVCDSSFFYSCCFFC